MLHACWYVGGCLASTARLRAGRSLHGCVWVLADMLVHGAQAMGDCLCQRAHLNRACPARAHPAHAARPYPTPVTHMRRQAHQHAQGHRVHRQPLPQGQDLAEAQPSRQAALPGVCVCVHACACVRARLYVCVCVRMCACVFV